MGATRLDAWGGKWSRWRYGSPSRAIRAVDESVTSERREGSSDRGASHSMHEDMRAAGQWMTSDRGFHAVDLLNQRSAEDF